MTTPDPMREALLPTALSLAGAINLLERGGEEVKKAAPSVRLFDQMLAAYKAALDSALVALAAAPQPAPERVTCSACAGLGYFREKGRWVGECTTCASTGFAAQPAPADREVLVKEIAAAQHRLRLIDCDVDESAYIADALFAAGWRRAEQAALDAAYRKGQEDIRERAAATYDEWLRRPKDYRPFDDVIRALPIQGGDDAA